MAQKRPLTGIHLAECKAAHDLFLSKKNALKLTQKQIAEAAGITPVSVNQYLKGINPLNARFATVLAKMLGEPIESFSPRLAAEIAEMAAASHGNVSPMQQPHREAREYPLLTSVVAGVATESSVPHPTGIADEWLTSTENAGPNGYWLAVKGKSMTSDTPPSFPPGTPILIRPEGFDLVSGKFYIAEHIPTGEYTFKQYVLDTGIAYLVPLNPEYQTVVLDENWQIVGRAIDAKITGM
ncbi:LexA family transcriptional repressor [Pseudomonas putida]|uniref:LexA family protein n=1 Tax=Pseudomonas putida TaxID=303 RepID=UPI000A1175AB|nr:XRE family transcriptional regulator [Pseudomonas putida]ORL70296.1 LexA family transcriptional repressor [Pseudomonas putida]